MVDWIVWGSIIATSKLDMSMGGEKMWGENWGNNCIVDIQTREDKILDKNHDLKKIIILGYEPLIWKCFGDSLNWMMRKGWKWPTLSRQVNQCLECSEEWPSACHVYLQKLHTIKWYLPVCDYFRVIGYHITDLVFNFFSHYISW